MGDFEDYTKEQLISVITSLKAHNFQLQNIINKSNKDHKSENKSKPQRPFNFEKCKYRHVLLKFLYLGWDYHGYVVQEDTSNTVEDQIFRALIKTCLIESRDKSNYHRCGRTDKGVSSFSQVISLDIRSVSDDDANELNYCKILNSVLPENIQFIAWCPVSEGFSARFDCKSRTYKYFFPRGSLDTDRMAVAGKYLEGSHDFRNFCKMDVNNGVVEFKRTILSVDVRSFDENDDNFSMWVLTIRGNAFLWHQIRCIVGVLILIGQQKEEAEVILELLDVTRNPRKPDYQMASEIPLNLYDCQYDNISWIFDQQTLNVVATKLHNFWTFTAVQAAMIKSMLTDVEQGTGSKHDEEKSALIPGIKTKQYVPIMKRQLCDSLEDKIERSAKRQKKKKNLS